MDQVILSVLEKLVDSPIPMSTGPETPDWTGAIPVPVHALASRTAQNWIIRQPVKMGGLGIRSCVETSGPAYVGGLEQALPHMTGVGGICQSLEEVVGECEGADRWQALLDSDCRTGRELAEVWTSLREQASQCAAYLSEEIRGPLIENVQNAGGGSRNGSTRRLVVAAREEVRAAVMKEAVPRLQQSNQRIAKAWLNRDKLSTAWLTTLPGPEGLRGMAFSEAMASTLCLPSPACRSRLGAKVGKKRVDLYGDNIQAAALPGDHWRTRHDSVKMTLNSLFNWARLPATCEVWNLFSHLIPGDALTRLESGRKRQALVPDFRLQLPSLYGGGETEHQLAELKLISCCDTWYKLSPRSTVRATDKRAQGLQQEYRRKAQKVDESLPTHRSNGGKGPVEQRLDEFGQLIGLCFGAWGEGSEDVHKLVAAIAEARLTSQGLQRGSPGSKQELGLITGQIRRRLSLAVVKAQTSCLLARLHQVGPGNAQLAKRREWALVEDERMKSERRAQWLRSFDGIKTLQKGQIKTE